MESRWSRQHLLASVCCSEVDIVGRVHPTYYLLSTWTCSTHLSNFRFSVHLKMRMETNEIDCLLWSPVGDVDTHVMSRKWLSCSRCCRNHCRILFGCGPMWRHRVFIWPLCWRCNNRIFYFRKRKIKLFLIARWSSIARCCRTHCFQQCHWHLRHGASWQRSQTVEPA